MRTITGLGRPIDPRYPSNRYAVVASAVAAAAAGTVALAAGAQSPLVWAIRGGLAAFLAWAVARELDPDDTRSAALAAPLGAVALAAGAPSLLAVAAALLAVRIVVRTTGLWPTTIDLVAMAVLAGVAGWQFHGVWAGLALGGALAVDTRLPRPAPLRGLGAGAVAAAAAVVTGVLGDGFSGGWAWPDVAQSMVLGAGALAVLALRTGPPAAAGDYTGVPLDQRRLQAGRLIAVTIVASTALAGGGAGVAVLGPVWAAFAGVALAPRVPQKSALARRRR